MQITLPRTVREARLPQAPSTIRRMAASLGGEGMIGLGLLLTFAVVAVGAPLLAPYDPAEFSGAPLERPSADHRLGTNDVGQDILSELIVGARISLAAAVGAAGGAVFLAVLIGGAAGYAGGWIDAALMRLVDVMMALPQLPLLILIHALLGAGLGQMILVFAALFWPGTARIIRAQVLSLRRRGYVAQARSFGAGPVYVLRRHILPAIGPLIVFGLVTAAGRAVVFEAGLAFLGLGDPTAKSWGLMMRYALNLPGLLLTDRWLWWLLPSGLCITLLVLALNLLGIGLEQRLDPRLKQR